MAFTTPDEFTTRYGYSPQDYFAKVVQGDAAAHGLVEKEAELVAAKAEVKAHAGWESAPDQATQQAGANAENMVDALTQQITALTFHRDAARKFLSGELGNYRPYLGNMGQWLAEKGWIDTTEVPT